MQSYKLYVFSCLESKRKNDICQTPRLVMSPHAGTAIKGIGMSDGMMGIRGSEVFTAIKKRAEYVLRTAREE